MPPPPARPATEARPGDDVPIVVLQAHAAAPVDVALVVRACAVLEGDTPAHHHRAPDGVRRRVCRCRRRRETKATMQQKISGRDTRLRYPRLSVANP